MTALRPCRFDPISWAALSEPQRDAIAVETLRRVIAHPKDCAQVVHQLSHVVEMLRRGPLTTAPPPVRTLRFASGRGAPR